MTKDRLPHDGVSYSEALDYARLPEPWCEWAKIATNFIWQVQDEMDREDLKHDILVRIADLAEEYRRQGRTLSKGGAIKVAEYTRLRFYHNKKRSKRVFSIDLNCAIRDEEGYETEMIQTIPDNKVVDLDVWLDANTSFDNAPKNIRKAILKLLTEDWRQVNGNDWKLIKQFRAEYKV